MLRLAFCTTAMNRTHYALRSIRNNLQVIKHYPEASLLVLDYNSSDGLEACIRDNFCDEVKSRKLLLYQTTQPKYFHMSHAKNVAHRLAITYLEPDILINTDTETLLSFGFAQYINDLFIDDPDTICTNMSGRIAIPADRFMQLHGYDELFIGWGVEDNDLRHRAQIIGLNHVGYHLCGNIVHTGAKRTKNYPPEYQNIKQTVAYNQAIMDQHIAGNIAVVNVDAPWGEAEVSQIMFQ